LARKFLYAFAGSILLVLICAVTFRLWGDRLLTAALVPSAAFTAPAPRSPARYHDAALWYAQGITGTLPRPTGAPSAPVRALERRAAIFFVHPTSYIDRAAWNAPDGDAGADTLARSFIDTQANVFDGLGPLWVPRYRQATFGAFLTDKPEAAQALGVAYRDVAAAFATFLAANPAGPIILAGHSQGARHLMHLLADRVAGRPVAARIAAVYLVGWPVSVTADLPALGLPGCTRADEPGCILSWQSFAQPAEPKDMVRSYEATRGLTGRPRAGTAMLCVNPLTGMAGGGAAPATASHGMLRRDAKDGSQTILRPGVGARCDPRGWLLIDGAPDLGPYVLPGNNYHVYDYMLFWPDVRTDANRRLDAFLTR
jgi:hypothetical protein